MITAPSGIRDLPGPLAAQRRTSSPSTPWSRPSKCVWPSTGSRDHDLGQPAARTAGSRRRARSGRSSPGDDTSSVYARSIDVLDVEQRAQVVADALAVLDADRRRPARPAAACGVGRARRGRSSRAGPSRSTRAGTARRRSRGRATGPRARRCARISFEALHGRAHKNKKWAPAHFSCLRLDTRSSSVYHISDPANARQRCGPQPGSRSGRATRS